MSRQKQPPEVFYKKGPLKNFAKLKKRLWHKLFSCEFCKIFNTVFTEHLRRSLLSRDWNVIFKQALIDDTPKALKLNQYYNFSILPALQNYETLAKGSLSFEVLTPDDTFTNVLTPC